ncbi:tetratricopeptide repeat protein [Bradyrhizobium sp. HKCCYLS2038]|uniref:tetratricopeptide repeat protein n=1 Tax=unclassified Bradyrhizobium TaxID=2631580 RepID=UPI003EC08098
MATTYRFNPGFQTDEESVQTFIVRKADLELALAPFRESASAPPRVLIVAPRGAGKTTLCRRVLAEVHQDPSLSRRWHPIFFGEESYAITTPGEFFLECLFHLQDRSNDGVIKAAYERALSHPGEEELLDLASKALQDFSASVGKRLLIIVENFQTILDDQIGLGAQDLLKRLSDVSVFGVLATSVSQLATAENVALPSDFLRIDLRPLSREECRALWNFLTKQEIKIDRIRPIEILTGGSPRMIHILAEFMRSPSLHNLMENLNFLIDQNTEYFKSQLDSLPPTERKIFAALLEAWDPATAKQVAEAARVSTNTASAMLARLAERGSVIKSPGSGKQALYSAAERLFNIYYLMRRRSHPSSRVRALVSFMTDYYDRDELIDTATTLAMEACSVRPDSRTDYHAFYDAILERTPTLVRTSILERTPPDFLTSFTAHQKAAADSARAHAPSVAVESRDADDELAELLSEADRLLDAGDTEKAINLYSRATEIRPHDAEAWMKLALIYLGEDRTDEALRAADESIRLRPQDPWGHAIKGMAHGEARELELAEAAFEAALSADADFGFALGHLARIKEEKGERKEAIELYERALRFGAITDQDRAGYAEVLQADNQLVEAESLLRGFADERDNFLSRRALAELLSGSDRRQEAIDLLRRAAEASQEWLAWADLGSFLAREGSPNDAVQALESSIAKGAGAPEVFVSYARALQQIGEPISRVLAVAKDLTERLPEDYNAWIYASLLAKAADDKTLSEVYVRKALTIEDHVRGWIMLAVLLQSQPKRSAEAEEAFREAVSVARKGRDCSAVRFLAEYLVHRGEETAAQEAIAKWFAGESPCYCCAVLEGDIAARNGDAENASRAYRSALGERDDGIEALTGLSRFVDRNEGEQLIARAMESDALDPRALLARARLRQNDPESQIRDALEAARLSPEPAEAQLFLARTLLDRGQANRALEHLKLALKDLPEQRELTAMFVDAAMAIAATGHGDRVSEMLKADEFGSNMEPLIVALRIKRGDRPVVAKEVLEVALDIANGTQGKRGGSGL